MTVEKTGILLKKCKKKYNIMKSIGICAGASSISLAGVEHDDSGSKILFSRSKAHDGNPRKVLRELLD
ncbi:MAG: hypothetical protein D3924_11020, partial [Candidatus Electrothrix sp. AR4]|nr:hypothetical protein [Candidatus Electrothrix sp. AR4]